MNNKLFQIGKVFRTKSTLEKEVSTGRDVLKQFEKNVFWSLLVCVVFYSQFLLMNKTEKMQEKFLEDEDQLINKEVEIETYSFIFISRLT